MNKRFRGLLILLVVGIAILWPNPTFNDVPAMQAKVAKEVGREQVTIFQVEEIDEYRFVGYSFDAQYGFAVFKQNDAGNYVYDHAYKRDNLIYRVEDIGVGHHANYWIAVSGNPALSTVQFSMEYNSGDKQDELITKQITECPSLSVIKLPEENFGGEYSFYDRDGNLIKQR